MAQKALLNGIEYTCNEDRHAFRQIIVKFKGLDDYKVVEDVMTTILIPITKINIVTEEQAQAYIDALANSKVNVKSTAKEVLEQCTKRGSRLYNFYSIYFMTSKLHYTPRQKNYMLVNKESKNMYVFGADMENTYRKYAISSVEVMDAFLKKMSRILEERDIALMVKDVDYTYANTRNVIYYSFNKVDDQVCPNSPVPIFDPDTGNCIYEMEVQFSASFADFIAYERFRKDFQQYTFVSNVISFETNGKAIIGWEDEKTPITKDYTMTNSVFWEAIGKEFTHQFQTNEKGNSSFPLEFNCKIRYNVVRGINERMKEINNIICEIVESDLKRPVNKEQLEIK